MTAPAGLLALGFLSLACGLGLIHHSVDRHPLRGGPLGVALVTVFGGGFFIGGGLVLMEWGVHAP